MILPGQARPAQPEQASKQASKQRQRTGQDWGWTRERAAELQTLPPSRPPHASLVDDSDVIGVCAHPSMPARGLPSWLTVQLGLTLPWAAATCLSLPTLHFLLSARDTGREIICCCLVMSLVGTHPMWALVAILRNLISVISDRRGSIERARNRPAGPRHACGRAAARCMSLAGYHLVTDGGLSCPWRCQDRPGWACACACAWSHSVVCSVNVIVVVDFFYC